MGLVFKMNYNDYETLHILQVKNLRKYNFQKWVTLHTLIDLKKYDNVELALEVTLRQFTFLKKEKDNLPLEFRFVKIRITDELNTIPIINSEEIFNKIKNNKK